MINFNFNIKEIFERPYTPVIISVFIGLLSFEINKDWVISALLGLSYFILTIFVNWCKEMRSKWKVRRYYENHERKKLNIIADETKTFFRCLNDNQLKAAVALYNLKDSSNTYSNERYVKYNDSNLYLYFNTFDLYFHNARRNFILCDNKDYCYNGQNRHYIIDPLFYNILENYVLNGISDFQESINIYDYKDWYRSM